MARLIELCLATLALMVAVSSAAPMPCGGGTGVAPPHCASACDQMSNCGEPHIEHDIIIDHDSDFYEHMVDHFEHDHGYDHDHDDDCFEFDDDDFLDEDEFDTDCEEGEDFLDGGSYDNEDSDFGEDIDCHHVSGCGDRF